MKVSTKVIFISAGIVGAFILGGTAAVLMSNKCKGPRICSLKLCNHTAKNAAEDDITHSTEMECHE